MQEELINISDCGKFESEWLVGAGSESKVNQIMVEKFKLFNEEVQSK